MTIAALIVAAGRGTRAGGDLPKQWQRLGGQTVAAHTLTRFAVLDEVAHIVLVLHADDMDRAPDLPGLILARGGETRAQSVLNGLEALEHTGTTHVLIHDVARPCVSGETIRGVITALRTHDAAAPALPVTDALWTGAGGIVAGSLSRDGLWRAQTPQGFRLDAILAAHRSHPGGAADDVEVARAAGLDVAITRGDEDNIKITHPGDAARADRILRGNMQIRVGNGYDVHRFGDGDHVILCGVRVPFGRGLQGHSDADVGLHALADAIYGALARGDIGRHFPPSDPQWNGAASDIFLRHAAGLAREIGFEISNMDVTLVCELPRIGPHADAMRTTIADICGVAPDQVSVKATTSERLGFTGRGEGIAALASVALMRP